MGATVLEVRRARELDPTLTLLRDLLMDATETPAEQFAQGKMQEIYELLDMLSGWAGELQTMNPDNLRRLMKLGSGVNKVLDMKGRFLNKSVD